MATSSSFVGGHPAASYFSTKFIGRSRIGSGAAANRCRDINDAFISGSSDGTQSTAAGRV